METKHKTQENTLQFNKEQRQETEGFSHESEMEKNISKKNALKKRKTKQKAMFANQTGMPDKVKNKMENAFGTDFSDIRIHENSKTAENLGAIAFTKGNDIHFKTGEFNPQTNKGQETLGHELTHVIQQKKGMVKPTSSLGGFNINTDSMLESQADLLGKQAANSQKTNFGKGVNASPVSNVSQMLFFASNTGTTNTEKLTVENVRKALGIGRFNLEGKTLKAILYQINLYSNKAIEIAEMEKKISTAKSPKKGILQSQLEQIDHFNSNEVEIAGMDEEETLSPEEKTLRSKLKDDLAEAFVTLKNVKRMIKTYQKRHEKDKDKTRIEGFKKVLNWIEGDEFMIWIQIENVTDENSVTTDFESNTERELESLVNDDLIKPVINSVFVEPLMKKLAYELGLEKKFFRKKNDARKLRDEMKLAGRKVAVGEIRTQSEPLGNTAKRQYVEMLAQSKAYSDVKQYVDAATMAQIESIINKYVDDSLKTAMKKAATSRFYVLQHSNKKYSEKDKILEATAEAEKFAKSKFKNIYDNAVKDANKLKEGEGRENIKSSVKQSVKGEYEGEQGKAIRFVKESMKADNVGKAMKILGDLIDLAVPKKGSSAAIDVQFKIPFTVSGGEVYVTIQYLGEVERDNMLRSRSELTMGVGVDVAKIFDLSVQFGLFIEASAQNSSRLMDLISYGFFRGLKRMSKPTERFANYLWGKGGKTLKIGSDGKVSGTNTSEDEAEAWAAVVEEDVFNNGDEDAYVETGMLGKLNAEANVGIGKLGAGLKGSHSTRITKDTLGALAGKKDKTKEEIKKVGEGQRLSVFELEGALNVNKFLSGSVAGKRIGLRKMSKNEKTGTLAWMVDAEFKFNQIVGDFKDRIKNLAERIIQIGKPLTEFIDKLVKKSQEKYELKKEIEALNRLKAPLGEMTSNSKAFAEKLIESAGNDFKNEVVDSANSSFDLGFGLHIGLVRDKPEDSFKTEFEISILKTKKNRIDFGIVSAEAESKQRFGKISWEEGKGGSGGLLGFGKY